MQAESLKREKTSVRMSFLIRAIMALMNEETKEIGKIERVQNTREEMTKTLTRAT